MEPTETPGGRDSTRVRSVANDWSTPYSVTNGATYREMATDCGQSARDRPFATKRAPCRARTPTEKATATGRLLLFTVREGGLEPPRPFEHWHLKPARLPIPPLAQCCDTRACQLSEISMTRDQSPFERPAWATSGPPNPRVSAVLWRRTTRSSGTHSPAH
jgi:hypothetical protein